MQTHARLLVSVGLFYFMPVNKYYTSVGKTDDKLEVFCNDQNHCTITMKDESSLAITLIELDTDDLSDLINELIYIKNQMKAHELY